MQRVLEVSMVSVKGAVTNTHSVSLMHENKYEIHAQMDVKWTFMCERTLVLAGSLTQLRQITVKDR